MICTSAPLATRRGENFPLRVLDEHGADLTPAFFHFDGPQIRLRRDIVPAMITPDQQIIRQDCLCYLMRPI